MKLAEEARSRYQCEDFGEWRRRYGLSRIQRADKVAMLLAEYNSAPVIPAVRIARPVDQAILQRCRALGGVLYEYHRRRSKPSPHYYPARRDCYFIDPHIYQMAEHEIATMKAEK